MKRIERVAEDRSGRYAGSRVASQTRGRVTPPLPLHILNPRAMSQKSRGIQPRLLPQGVVARPRHSAAMTRSHLSPRANIHPLHSPRDFCDTTLDPHKKDACGPRKCSTCITPNRTNGLGRSGPYGVPNWSDRPTANPARRPPHEPLREPPSGGAHGGSPTSI